MRRPDLRTPKGVRKVLKDVNVIRAKAYDEADYSAIDILIDLEHAINEADLTEKQREAIYYVYEKSYTQQQTAELVSADRTTVSRHLNAAIRKIAAVFREWDYNTT